MAHLEEEQLVQAYYGENNDRDVHGHLKQCAECQAAFEKIKDLLGSLSGYPVPERGEQYGAEVWARVVPHLPLAKTRPRWQRPWLLAPIAAALLAVAFFAGLVTQERRQLATSSKVRERVLLMAISAHLDRSQIALAELLHTTDTGSDLVLERERSRDLINENRLLRESALQLGDRLDANLLAELEPVFIEVANSSSTWQAADLHSIQQRIESQGLLFKVRVSGADTRERGQRL